MRFFDFFSIPRSTNSPGRPVFVLFSLKKIGDFLDTGLYPTREEPGNRTYRYIFFSGPVAPHHFSHLKLAAVQNKEYTNAAKRSLVRNLAAAPGVQPD